MKKYFLIISLFICFNLTAAEIEIISDKPGDGKKIIYHSWVQIEYTGSFESGEVFDTNIGKDRPLVVQMGMKEVIPGFEQGIMGTTKGTKRKIKIPAEQISDCEIMILLFIFDFNLIYEYIVKGH